jgi:type I restriction enzyme S subunit
LQEFALPPLDKQRRIAEMLWAVDEAWCRVQASCEAMMRFERACLYDVLGGFLRQNKTSTLGELSDFVTSGSRGWAEYYDKNGALFIRSQNVRNQILDFADLQRVQPPIGAEGARTKTRPGDLLITITGNSVGNVAYVPDGLEEAYVSQHVGLVRLKDPEMHRMLVAFFGASGPGNEQILKAQYGLKPGLNLEQIRRFIVPDPTHRELLEILSTIRNQDSLKAALQLHVSSSLKLKHDLLNRLIS